MEEYICKIATLEEMEQNWNYLIKIHPDNNAWKIYKDEAIKNMQNGEETEVNAENIVEDFYKLINTLALDNLTESMF